MRTHSLLVVALALPLAAQGYVPDPVRPVSPAAPMRSSHGLAASGDALRGGGADYRVRFDGRGMRFEPALGERARTTQHLALRPIEVHCGEAVVLPCSEDRVPRHEADTASYVHAAGVTERYEVRADGVALSWLFAERPAGTGDLVVRYAVETSLPAPVADGDGLVFRTDCGGVAIGGVTGIDANGRTAAGSTRWVDGRLELALPAAFVAAAAFPLVLDPIIGTVFSVSVGLTFDDDEPDVAYHAPTQLWLVAWRRRFSANDMDVRGQRVDSAGSLVGGTIFFGSGGIATRPRIAVSATWGLFGVAWVQEVTGTITTSQVVFQTVTTTGLTDNYLILATSGSQTYEDVDIGSMAEQLGILGSAFFVVYRAPGQAAVRARRVTMLSANSLLQSTEFSVFTDVPLGVTYSQPAISRTCWNGNLLVVARRSSVLTSGRAIEAAVVHTYDNTIGPVVTVTSSTSDDASAPDVDGVDSRWVVAWDRQGASGTYDAVRVAPAALDAAGTTLSVGATTTFGGSVLSLAKSPSVGWSPARTWIGYQGKSILPNVITTLRVAAVDTASCADCNDSWGVQVFNDETRIVVAPQVGGSYSEEDALAVYGAGPALDVYAQRLRNYGTGGTQLDLGGGCGVAGPFLQAFSHAPGIGSTAYRCSVGPMPFGTVAAIFNFSSPAAPLPCGACQWIPFVNTQVAPIAASSAAVAFPIPCLPTLVGAQFETQWTLISSLPAVAPCALFPGLFLSGRTLHTIGQ